MDFSFTKEQTAIKEELWQFLQEELPQGWKGEPSGESYGSDEAWLMFKDMARKMGTKGWLALRWPSEYGGLDRREWR